MHFELHFDINMSFHNCFFFCFPSKPFFLVDLRVFRSNPPPEEVEKLRARVQKVMTRCGAYPWDAVQRQQSVWKLRLARRASEVPKEVVMSYICHYMPSFPLGIYDELH